jgi:hypothetical protein
MAEKIRAAGRTRHRTQPPNRRSKRAKRKSRHVHKSRLEASGGGAEKISDFFDPDRMSVSKLRFVKKAAKPKNPRMGFFERFS